MRDFKFRLWDKFNESMVYSEDLCDFFDYLKKLKEGDNNPVLMQDTGLVDMDGINVYEGDLVVVPVSSANRVYLIVWMSATASFMMKSLQGDTYTSLSELSNCYKVVGNIYQTRRYTMSDAKCLFLKVEGTANQEKKNLN